MHLCLKNVEFWCRKTRTDHCRIVVLSSFLKRACARFPAASGVGPGSGGACELGRHMRAALLMLWVCPLTCSPHTDKPTDHIRSVVGTRVVVGHVRWLISPPVCALSPLPFIPNHYLPPPWCFCHLVIWFHCSGTGHVSNTLGIKHNWIVSHR